VRKTLKDVIKRVSVGMTVELKASIFKEKVKFAISVDGKKVNQENMFDMMIYVFVDEIFT
jgi:hypothetical protein